MKKLLIVLCTVGLLATSPVVRADDDHKQGGSTSGVENLQVNAAFIATSNAPAGASGTLKIRGKNRHGTAETEMKIKTHGLPGGTYNVSATLKSDGSVVSLGQMTLAPENEDEDENADGDENTGDDATRQSAKAKKPKVNSSESEVEIPLEVSAMDLASVTIADATDVPLLVADLVNAPGKSLVVFHSRVAVLSDDPAVKGAAVLTTAAHKGKKRGNFVMVVHKLPANTSLHVVVNGEDTGTTVTTNKRGSVVVKKLTGQDLSNVHSVALQDDSSVTLAHADF
ncbi:MAG: hypothetical protein JWM68_3107 [Verrucomicrobiales bacterium]|nr:hypothetical protein [Verrucomicrobiales bacterium]